MQVFRRSPGDGEGLQPRHPTRDLRCRERRQASRTHRRRNRECDCDRDGRQHLARLCHAEPVSQWKGFSPGMTGMRAIYAASLAKRGFERPSGLLEGPDGLERMFGQPIHVDWDDPSLEIVNQTCVEEILLAYSWPARAGGCA